MADSETRQPYIKGKFTGLFTQTKKKHNGIYVFSEIHWTYLHIVEFQPIDNFDALEHRTGDYWFSEKITSKKFSPFRKTTEIFIPVGENEKYSGDLHNVLIRNLKYTNEKSDYLSKDWTEATGDIYFQLDPVVIKKEVVVPPKPEETPKQPSETTVIENKVKENAFVKNPSTNVRGTNIITSDPVIVSGGNSNLVLEPTTSTGGCFGLSRQNGIANQSASLITGGRSVNWFGKIFKYLLYALIAYYLWTVMPILSIAFLVSVILGELGGLGWIGGILKTIATLAILGFIGYFLYTLFYVKGMKGEPVKTRDGKVKIAPPKRSDNGDKNQPDYSTQKDVEWYDFMNQFYIAKYNTSQTAFENSVDGQEKIAESINENNSISYFTNLYDGLQKMDQGKIKEITQIFRDSAQKKNMNQLEIAEMVITFIQEIPYYLVHEGSCSEAISTGNDFLVEYHEAHKPCLPNITAGVQSPYEFLHNLKGDCDTRSLLGYSILTELGISSSVWVSQSYGHSIMGVAVPAGHGMYKEIDGIRHYAVELTAKGFRLGMVSPDQAYPNNWDITAYNNNY